MSEQGPGLSTPAGWSQKDVRAYDMLGVSPKRERTPGDPNPGSVTGLAQDLDHALADLHERIGMLASFLEPVMAPSASDATVHAMAAREQDTSGAPLALTLNARLGRVQVLRRDIDTLIERLRIQ